MQRKKVSNINPFYTFFYLLTNIYSVYTVNHIFTCLALYISYNDVQNPSLQVSTFSSLSKCCVPDNSELEIFSVENSDVSLQSIPDTRRQNDHKKKKKKKHGSPGHLHVKQVLQLTKGSVNNRRRENISAKYQSRAKLKLSEKTGALCWWETRAEHQFPLCLQHTCCFPCTLKWLNGWLLSYSAYSLLDILSPGDSSTAPQPFIR